MDTFAREGLRTLVVAQAELNPIAFEEWADNFEEVGWLLYGDNIDSSIYINNRPNSVNLLDFSLGRGRGWGLGGNIFPCAFTTHKLFDQRSKCKCSSREFIPQQRRTAHKCACKLCRSNCLAHKFMALLEPTQSVSGTRGEGGGDEFPQVRVLYLRLMFGHHQASSDLEEIDRRNKGEPNRIDAAMDIVERDLEAKRFPLDFEH